MGVPSFFRWVINRYPHVLEKLEHAGCGDLPQSHGGAGRVDNLYLDMNGIIHPCFHPEHGEPPKSEEEVYARILAYIDVLLAVVRPRLLLYLAVDGPAPRAKMNQQRARRFKAAQEAEQKKRLEAQLREKWRARGRPLPPSKEEEMDSNVITPGTTFMANLGRWLRHYAYMKLNDPSEEFAGLRIVLSDASVPGEGEHKVMSYIRAQRHAAGYDPNQHHCIHGLDADLIMLALATHEPRFSILREVRERRNAPRKTNPHAPPNFELVRVNVLREYLQREFEPADWSGVRDGFQMERVIDDFIFLCFFVGNDFLPHMPALEIRDGAIDAMLLIYKKCVSTHLGGYVTCNGDVNFTRLQALLGELGQLERDIVESKRFQDQQQQRQRERRDKQDRLDRLARLEADKLDEPYRGQEWVQQQAPPPAGQGYGSAARQAFLKRKGMDDPVAIVGGKKRLRSEVEEVEDGGTLPPGLGEEEEDEELDGGELEADSTPRPEAEAEGSIAPAGALEEELDGGSLLPFEETEEELEGGQLPPPPRALTTFAPARSSEWTPQDDAMFNAELKAATSDADKELEEQVDKVRLGEAGWRDRYYEHKLKIGITEDEKRRQVALEYIRGLCWVLRYYFQGVPSWTWYYPYHYAPCASDLIGIPEINQARKFHLGEPFPPLEQLLAVLPPLSAGALPPALREVFDDPQVAEFFPRKVEFDLNGARELYKAVVLLPFIDAHKLRAAAQGPLQKLSSEDRNRNRFGPNYIYVPARDPIAREMWQLAEENKHLDGFKMAQVVRPVQADLGIAALLTPYPSVPARATRSAPSQRLEPVTNNKVASAVLRLPSAKTHVSQLLPNVQLPPPTLGPLDNPVPNVEEQTMARSLYSSGGLDGYHQQVQAGAYAYTGRYM